MMYDQDKETLPREDLEALFQMDHFTRYVGEIFSRFPELG